MADNNSRRIEINKVSIPLRIKKSSRPIIRFSISKTALNLTVPEYINSSTLSATIEKARDWATEKIMMQPKLLEPFKLRNYENGENWSFLGRNYEVIRIDKDLLHPSVKLIKGQVQIATPQARLSLDHKQELPAVFSRAAVKHCLKMVENRVIQINDRFFQEEISRVKMKYTKSNWGSCSNKRNINLSSRLLLAPTDVLDYVIIHELAHLKEMNHSFRFWKWVSSAMPDFRQKEAWLKTNGHKLNY